MICGFSGSVFLPAIIGRHSGVGAILSVISVCQAGVRVFLLTFPVCLISVISSCLAGVISACLAGVSAACRFRICRIRSFLRRPARFRILAIVIHIARNCGVSCGLRFDAGLLFRSFPVQSDRGKDHRISSYEHDNTR